MSSVGRSAKTSVFQLHQTSNKQLQPTPDRNAALRAVASSRRGSTRALDVVPKANEMLNRGVLIVTPAQPYIAWASSLDDSGIVPAVDGEKTIYLVPSFEDDAEAERVLNLVYAEVFESELFGWHTDDSAWPKRRTLTMFKEWFKIEMHSMVEDLCSDELIDDDV